MRLLLLRHAKSSWGDPSLSDHDRPLNPRGERAATLMGVWMAQEECLPDLVLCSSARRTRETYARLCTGLGETPDLEIDEQLYGASPSQLLAGIAGAPDAVSTLLLIAHNPGIEDLVRLIAPRGDAGALQRAASGMGTAHLAEIGLDATKWADVEPGAGRLERLVRPKELV